MRVLSFSVAPEFPHHRDCYAGTAAALRDTLRRAVERGGAPSPGVLHQGVASIATPTGNAVTAQAGRICRRLDRLPDVPRTARSRLCAARCGVQLPGALPLRSLSQSRMERCEALELLVAHTAPLLRGARAERAVEPSARRQPADVGPRNRRQPRAALRGTSQYERNTLVTRSGIDQRNTGATPHRGNPGTPSQKNKTPNTQSIRVRTLAHQLEQRIKLRRMRLFARDH